MNLENDNKVYLTESSYRQLVTTSAISDFNYINATNILKEIYDDWRFYKIFNRFDIEFLFKNFLLLSGDTENIHYRRVEERKDNLGYIIEVKGKLKYHLIPTCEGLNKGFRNFFMPESVARIEDPTRREEMALEVRNWFKSNDYTIERYLKGEINDKILSDSFNNFFPVKFGVDFITISQSDKGQFKWYVEKKSETTKSIDKNFSDSVFRNNVDSIIKERIKICNNSKQLYNLSTYDFLYSKNIDEIKDYLNDKIEKNYLKEVSMNFLEDYGWEPLKIFFELHVNLKSKAKIEFTNLLKWKYNLSQLKLQNIRLEDFNFECCTMCILNR